MWARAGGSMTKGKAKPGAGSVGKKRALATDGAKRKAAGANPSPAVNGDIPAAITTGNFKVIATEWMAFAERFMQSQLVLLSNGRLLQPDDPVLHHPQGIVAQWQALETAHRVAVAEAQALGNVPDAMMPWIYPQFDRFVLHFMAAALQPRAREPRS